MVSSSAKLLYHAAGGLGDAELVCQVINVKRARGRGELFLRV